VILGTGHLIDGFDSALRGVTDGDNKTFTLSPAEAYGDRDDDATTVLEKTMFPEDFEFTDGMTIPLSNEEGRNFMTTLTEQREEEVTVDFNHPLAGKNLTFEVEVISVVPQDELPKVTLPDETNFS
jgi:FKBP-type peptidyl-prolyl cis-trans isomerase 2